MFYTRYVSYLICFIHDISSALDKGYYIDTSFVDFLKTFYLVNHQLLCMKLSK